jgi:hypothetical protein
MSGGGDQPSSSGGVAAAALPELTPANDMTVLPPGAPVASIHVTRSASTSG